ncbi:MAG: ATP-binding protein [Neomegalonema sp.]|nr:ATP-binding protein [Neomegalonema sp.]
MSDAAYRDLKAALEAGPDNVLLRLTVLRLAHGAGELSDALAIAAPLQPDQVSAQSDRALIAGLYEAAGLGDRAQLWQASPALVPGEAPTDDAPPAGAGAEEGQGGAPQDGASGSNPWGGAIKPDGKPSLRVIGGGADSGGSTLDAADAYGPSQAERKLVFADVGGLEEVKKDVRRRIILPFKQPGLLSRFKKRTGGGVMLYGPPGCGKTLLARATAGECDAKFYSVSLAEVLDPYVGVSERNLRGVFETARAETPAVIFFDEIDALGAKRRPDSSSHASQLANLFLSELDGTEARNDGVLVLGATNAPWSLDAAFMRPGRFDRLFFVPPPDRPAREAILALELRDRGAVGSVDTAEIAAMTSGYSGADLAHIVELAADDAIDATLEKGVEVPISQDMLRAAARQAKPTVREWLATARNYATYANEGGRYDDVMAFLEKHGKR